MRHLLFVLILAIAGCVSTPSTDLPTVPDERIALSWETVAERAEWSDYMISKIKANKATYDAAKDVTMICPKYASLSERDQLKAWGEYWVALGYYESSYNPKSSSVDVGNPKNRGTYSDGLYQVSETDQGGKAMTGTERFYKYTDLLKPLPNIDLAVAGIFPRQIRNGGLIFLPNSSKYRYWAPTLVGNKYSKIPEIIARVKKNAPACN